MSQDDLTDEPEPVSLGPVIALGEAFEGAVPQLGGMPRPSSVTAMRQPGAAPTD